MIHAYSLVHDDLPALDDDDLRRGRPTVHRRFDEATAILAGDALLTAALSLLSSAPDAAPEALRRRAVALVAEAIGTAGMIGGQADDLEAERAWPADPAAALDAIHRRKTGALITCSLRLGGLYAGEGAAGDDLLRRAGEALGLLFQIGDDLLDVEGHATVIGKTAGKDAKRRKLTYPAVHGIEHSQRRLAELAGEARRLVAELPSGGGRLTEFIDELSRRRS
jgi:geranylgeranyl pyrophosphate synthase